MKLLSFSGSDLAVNHFLLQPSEMASVSQDSDSFFAPEMQKVLLDVMHLYYKVLVVVDHLFIFLMYRMYHKQAPIPVYFKRYHSITMQAFLIISPPLPQAFQDFKCFLFRRHTSQTLDFIINMVRRIKIQTFPIEKSSMYFFLV